MASHVTPGHAGPVLNRIGIEMVRSRASRPHAAAFLWGIQIAELASDKMLKLVNDKFLIADNTLPDGGSRFDRDVRSPQ
jgi:hypothetical protein